MVVAAPTQFGPRARMGRLVSAKMNGTGSAVLVPTALLRNHPAIETMVNLPKRINLVNRMVSLTKTSKISKSRLPRATRNGRPHRPETIKTSEKSPLAVIKNLSTLPKRMNLFQSNSQSNLPLLNSLLPSNKNPINLPLFSQFNRSRPLPRPVLSHKRHLHPLAAEVMSNTMTLITVLVAVPAYTSLSQNRPRSTNSASDSRSTRTN